MRKLAYTAKSILLGAAQRCGAFEYAARHSKASLRILCYHGISFADEHRFYPGTFMRAETFRNRMASLRDWGANVLSLSEAIEGLNVGELPDKAVVLTIDDGWYGTYSQMWPVLKEFEIPATLYASTYYMQKQGFVFNLYVDYAFRRSAEATLKLSEIDSGMAGTADLRTPAGLKAAIEEVRNYGEKYLNHETRQALCRRLADHLGLDVQADLKHKLLQFMDLNELSELSARGLDIQLHTHTHRFSGSSRNEAYREIEKNLVALDSAGIKNSKHFCYPSGLWVSEHSNWLPEFGIASATTTDFGLANSTDSPYYLPRICDSDNMSQLDFMGAISGFKTLLRGRDGAETSPRRR